MAEPGLTLNLLLTAFIILFGSSFLFGYNIGALNPISDYIKTFYWKTYNNRGGGNLTLNGTKYHSTVISEDSILALWSFTVAIYLPGGMAGAMLAGFFADRIGRKKSILFSHIFTFVASILAAVCQKALAPELLMLSRLIQGFNCGIGGTIAPMYLSEISTYKLRGAFGTAHQLFVTIGIFMGSVFGLKVALGTQVLWYYVPFLNAVPALVSLLVLPFLPESPRFLFLVRQQERETETALKFLRKSTDVTFDMNEMKKEQQEKDTDGDEENFSLKELLTSADLRLPLILAVVLQIIQQFSGINAIFFFSGSIFEKAQVSSDLIPYAILAVNAVNVAMTIISVPLMDIAGRRPLLLYPMIGMMLDLILITISLNLQKKDCCSAGMEYLSIVAVVIYVICFAVGLGPIPLMIGAELFRQAPRPKAMGVAAVTNWVGTFIIAMSFEALQKKLLEFTFLVFLGLMIIFTLFVLFKVPETKNKTFEEIAQQLSRGGGNKGRIPEEIQLQGDTSHGSDKT